MRTMSENSFICIKINSWLRRIPPAPLSTTGFVQVNLFNSWPLSDLIRSDQTKISSAFLSTTDLIQINISIADPPGIKREPRQHSSLSSAHTDQIWIFFSWNNPPKTTSYKDFWWFSYRRIFPPIFLHGLNFEFISFHSLLYSMINDQFLIIFIDETELFGKVIIDDRVI